MSDAKASFERINYSVRPAKATQRHMLVEAIGRLSRFATISDYQYIGFGSTFFVDFKLLHQRFGLTKLVSIEQEVEKRLRFELNRPYQSVEMLYGTADAKLIDPSIDWNADPAVVWLDYDEHLDTFKLGDCGRVLARAKHGSMLIVSFSVEAGPYAGDDREDIWRARLGSLVPHRDTHATLDDGRVADISLGGLTAYAKDQLADAGGEKVFRQLFRFRYDDGHPMATWGGVILDRDREAEIDQCRFDRLPFVVADESTYVIEVPNLTPIERAMAEKYLPRHVGRARAALRRNGIPDEEATRLAAVYRYAPSFVETFA